jgi:hypothetical protein
MLLSINDLPQQSNAGAKLKVPQVGRRANGRAESKKA